jgi:hypothetical protein
LRGGQDICKTSETYEADFWTLNKDIAKLLAAFERKVLKRTWEGIKVDGSLRKRYNRELMQPTYVYFRL